MLEETLSHGELDGDLIARFQIPPIAPGATFRPLFPRALELARAGGLESFVESEEMFGQAGLLGVLFYRLLVLPGEIPAFRGFITRYRTVAEMGYEETFAQFGSEANAAGESASTLHGLSTAFVPQIVWCNEAVAYADAMLCLAHTALAMHSFRRRVGTFPGTLNELVPKDLEQLPVDPFDGKPLRLTATKDGWTLYSVGPDGVDHGGTRFDPSDLSADHDVIFEYPRQRPEPRWK